MRVAIVGAGLMGRWHAHEAGHARGTVAGICDTDLASAERLARVVGARAFTGFEEMLAAVTPEVVHVCTPPASHLRLTETALRSGAHVIVEKPVAPTARETEQLLAVADLCGRLVSPVHQIPFQRSVRAAVRALEGLGPVVDVSWFACSAGAVGLSAAGADEVAADVLPHPLSVLQRLLPGDVATLDWSVSRPRAGDLRASAVREGTSISVLVSMAGRPTRNELRVTAAGGTVHADLFHDFMVRERGGVSRLRKATRPFVLSGATTRAATVNLGRRALRREPAYPGLRALITDVYAFARDGGTPPIPHEENLAVARARDRILAAAGPASSGRGKDKV